MSSILCIDLKSFYAFVECVERKIDPYNTALVVANKKQGNGAITLAITPYLKSLGVKSRSRLFDIPKNINYTIVPPRMGMYVEKSKEIINIYLDFVSKEDLHVYSVDEAFLDLTNYLKLYNKNSYDIAKMIMKRIKKLTGLECACGIGSNMFMAKVALDNEAKNNIDQIAIWSCEDIQTKLWNLTPLSKMWGIGFRMEKNLNNLGIFTVKDLALYDVNILKHHFGVIGEEYYNHANGIDESKISDKYNVRKSVSFSNSQILFKDYNENNIKIILLEMLEVLTKRLRLSNKVCGGISLGISYSKEVYGGFNHSLKLDTYTDDINYLFKYINILFDKHYTNEPIRKVAISLFKISNNSYLQLNLFDSFENILDKKNLNNAKDNITLKYGKNSLIPASALLEDSTLLDRNKKIGGHSA